LVIEVTLTGGHSIAPKTTSANAASEPNLYELWRLRLFSFGGYGLALAVLALVVFGAIECPPINIIHLET